MNDDRSVIRRRLLKLFTYKGQTNNYDIWQYANVVVGFDRSDESMDVTVVDDDNLHVQLATVHKTVSNEFAWAAVQEGLREINRYTIFDRNGEERIVSIPVPTGADETLAGGER